MFEFGNALINLRQADQAPEPIAPAAVAPSDAGARKPFAIEVDDVDAMHREPMGVLTSSWKELERETRFELATCSLEGCRSTN